MSLNLDPRQRAMLREMGVRVWQPLAAAVPTPQPAAITMPTDAIKLVANGAHELGADGTFDAKTAVSAANSPVHRTARAKPESPHAAQQLSPRTAPQTALEAAAWGVGQAQLLYAVTGSDAEPVKDGGRWLVLAELAPAALQAAALDPNRAPLNAFDGDAGRLLDNMLRAARLNRARSLHLVPLARHINLPVALPTSSSAGDAPVAAASSLPAILAPLVAATAPDVLLVMGRFAAQALLQSDLPFGKLRGQVHTLCGKPAIVTLDAGYLLRNQADKAKAWEDLKLAMRVAAAMP